MKLYNNSLTERLVKSSCIRPFVNDKGLVCRCGQCYACKQIDRLNWSFRLNEESNSSYVFCKFGCTVTYSNQYLPILNTKTHKVTRLNKPDGYDLNLLPDYKLPVLFTIDRQKFIADLRNRIAYKYENIFVRFFCSAEYGGANNRPHFHFALWFCVIDPSKPVYLVLKRDKDKNIVQSIPIPDAMMETSFASVVKGWIQGTQHYFVDGESDNHPFTPSKRCEHIKSDLWPYAEARLKYNPKYDRLMWSCVSIEVLGENYGAYLGGYLAKSDHKVLYPASVFSPEKRAMSKGNTFTLDDGTVRFFGCIGFEFCERNKETYMSQLHESQRTFKCCHMLREIKVKKDSKEISKLVLLPRAFVRYYYRLYDGYSENWHNRYTKVFRYWFENYGLSFSLHDVSIKLTEKLKNEKLFNRKFVPARFTGADLLDKYLYRTKYLFCSFKEVAFAFYKWVHSPRRLQSLYYSVEVSESDKVFGDKLVEIGSYFGGKYTFTDNSDFSRYIAMLHDEHTQKYNALARRTLETSELKANKKLPFVRSLYRFAAPRLPDIHLSPGLSTSSRLGWSSPSCFIRFVKRQKLLTELPFLPLYNYQIPSFFFPSNI